MAIMRKSDGGQRRAATKKRRVWPVVLLAAAITAAALAAVFGPDALDYLKTRHIQNDLRDMYGGSSEGSLLDLLGASASAEENPVPSEPVVHEDFLELYEANPHLVGWLSAGENIDYPVVQYDNSYYLDHDYFGGWDDDGTLFVNEANKLDPRDSILLIHGHNMKSGAMFGDLDYFREYSYLCEYPIVTFRTISDDEDVYYAPIAAFDASMTPDAYGYFNIGKIRFDFDEPVEETTPARSAELEEHISAMRDLSFWDSPVEADSTDEYIILVTCSYNHDNGRMMLVCRRLREGETPESISELFNQ